jgi:hypothetical protein
MVVNNRVYELNEQIRAYLADCAERAYSDNEYVSTWWKEPSTLVIETAGKTMPYEYIDSPDDEDDEEESRPFFLQEPESDENVAQPESSDKDTIPEKPLDMPEDEVVVFAAPEQASDEWEVGKAAIPTSGMYERDFQMIADTPRKSADEKITDEKGEMSDGGVSASERNDHWEGLLRSFDCEQLRTVENDTGKSGQESRKPDSWYDEQDQPANDGQVGARWSL